MTVTSIYHQKKIDLNNHFLQRISKSCQNFRLECAKDVPGIVGARTYAKDILHNFSKLTKNYTQHDTDWALIAVGGLGRGELSFASDIDVLFVYRKRLLPWQKIFIETLVQSLWDTGFQTGHVVSSLTGLKRLLSQDLRMQTSCLINQFIAGDKSLLQELVTFNLYKKGKRNQRDFFQKLIACREERLRLYGESIYLLEPHIKDGLGSLRDIHTIYWLAKRFLGDHCLVNLSDKMWLSTQELHWLEQAEDFLWRVRLQLHYLTNRHQDHLRFEEQENIAKRLGFSESSQDVQAVEAFMRLYYRHTARIRRITTYTLEHLQEIIQKSKSKKVKPKILPGPFVLESGQIQFYEPGLIQNNPGLLMKFFWTAARTGSHFYHDTGQIIRQNLIFFTSEWSRDSQVTAWFFDILSNKENAFYVLKGMMETGFLETFLPEFSPVRHRVQYDVYHLYTVDEHLLRTFNELHKLEQDQIEEIYLGQIPPSRLFQQIEQKRILFLAGLLHDIGKGEGKGHAEKGAEKAKVLGERLGLAESESELLFFLIKNHLLLPETALKRDLSEELPVERCALEIGEIERLYMLYLLCVADSRATGPQVWNAWRATLLAELFLKVEHILKDDDWKNKRLQEQVYDKQERLRNELSRLGWGQEVEDWIGFLSFRYLLSYSSSEILDHFQLEKRLEDLGPQLVFKPLKGDIWQLTLVCYDRQALFDDITGVLWAHGLNVLSADVITRSYGKVLDILQIGQLPDPLHPEKIWKRVEKNLFDLLSKRETLDSLFGRNFPKARLSVKSRPSLPRDMVSIDEEASDFYTVIEVYTYERPGVLHMISRTLHSFALSIRFAKISTPGAQAVDVFYVITEEGNKILDNNLHKQLKDSLLQTLSIQF